MGAWGQRQELALPWGFTSKLDSSHSVKLAHVAIAVSGKSCKNHISVCAVCLRPGRVWACRLLSSTVEAWVSVAVGPALADKAFHRPLTLVSSVLGNLRQGIPPDPWIQLRPSLLASFFWLCEVLWT